MRFNPAFLGACLAAAIAAITAAGPARAGVINPGFESGLTGWATVGDVATRTAAFGSGPTLGAAQAVITNAFFTLSDFDPAPMNLSGTDALTVAALTSFLGVAGNALDVPLTFGDAYEGSAIQQTFAVQVGDTLSFDWNFVTNELLSPSLLGLPPAPDHAFVVIDGVVSTLTTATTATLVPSASPFVNEVGYQAFSHVFATAGLVTLAFGVVDSSDFRLSSALLVDNVQIAPAAPIAVPEPDSLALIAAGLLALGALRRRRGA